MRYGLPRFSKMSSAAIALGLKIVRACDVPRRMSSTVVDAVSVASSVARVLLAEQIYRGLLNYMKNSALSYQAHAPGALPPPMVVLPPAPGAAVPAAGVMFFGAVGVGVSEAFALSLVYRVCAAVLWSLPGGVVLLLRKDRASVEEVERAMTSDEESTT